MSRTVMNAALMGLIAAIGLAAWLLDFPELARIVSELFILVVLVVGLYVFIGNSGVLSFGHMGFMAVGAYVTAWVTMAPEIKQSSLTALPEWLLGMQLPGPLAMASAAVAGAAVSLAAGAVLMRLAGVSASIASFAFMAIVYALTSNWTDGTGGTASLIGVSGFASLGATALTAMASIIVAGTFDGSRQGVMLRATREDEVAAIAIGISPYRVRLIAFVLSAAVVGVAGSLHASFVGVVSPDAYFVDATFVALAMLVMGGMQSLEGAVLGPIFFTGAKQILLVLERGVSIGSLSLHIPHGTQELAIAVLICCLLIYRPQGLMSGVARSLALKRS